MSSEEGIDIIAETLVGVLTTLLNPKSSISIFTDNMKYSTLTVFDKVVKLAMSTHLYQLIPIATTPTTAAALHPATMAENHKRKFHINYVKMNLLATLLF